VEDRVAIFIDGSNLYHGLKNNFHRQNINFSGFIYKLCNGRPLFRTYYYNVLQDAAKWPETYKEQQDFLDMLNKTAYLEVRLGGTKVAQGQPVEKGIDIMLATDLLYFGWQNFYDVAILVSGDSDFTYALKVVKNMGKHVEVAYFENAVSRELTDIADSRHIFNEVFFRGLWAPGKYSRRRKPYKRPAPIAASEDKQGQ
jgi:uncharacterized LabA/DUF88 family protein